MSDIFYEYGGAAYANLTNKCPCSCAFCIRQNGDALGNATNLWLAADPDMDEILEALEAFHLEKYDELVFCGYGEPTYALENLVRTARYVKEHYDIKTRLNTNGLGALINGRDIIPLIAPYIDTVSISLNAPDEARYIELCQPAYDGAYQAMLDFTAGCKGHIKNIKMTVVDVISADEIEACRRVADGLGVGFRVRAYT